MSAASSSSESNARATSSRRRCVQRGVDAAHLGADNARAAAVERAAKLQRYRLGAVPGAHDGGAAEREAIDRLLQRRGIAADLDRHVELQPYSFRWRQHEISADLARQVASLFDRLDGA